MAPESFLASSGDQFVLRVNPAPSYVFIRREPRVLSGDGQVIHVDPLGASRSSRPAHDAIPTPPEATLALRGAPLAPPSLQSHGRALAAQPSTRVT